MPRRRRYWENHACYHITHRCHERQNLFRFAKYREEYRKRLSEATRRFNISVLGYVVVSNHTHVLIATGERGRPQVSEALQYVHGEVAQFYNLQRDREGSFWSNRFYSTWVQTGIHLSRCLFYIDMNAVRAGLVSHPAEWVHGSAYELASDRERYRVVDRDRLLERLEIPDWDTYRQWYDRTLTDIIQRKLFMARQAFWSSSAAVGDAEWLGQAAGKCGLKRYDLVDTEMPDGEIIKSHFIRAKNLS